jgi:hypothetical protein
MMKTCPSRKVGDLACLECLLSDHLEGVDERGTLEIVEVLDEVD